MYKCNCCENLVHYLPTSYEHHPEISPDCYERYADHSCPCGGEYVKAYRCEICGDYFTENEMKHGICENCLEDGGIDQMIKTYTFLYENERDKNCTDARIYKNKLNNWLEIKDEMMEEN